MRSDGCFDEDVYGKTMLDSYPDVLQPADVMEILHVGRNTVYSWLAQGTIESKKIGKKYIIPKVNLIRFLVS